MVRKVIRTGAPEFHRELAAQPLPGIGPWRDHLNAMRADNERGYDALPRRLERSPARGCAELPGGFGGGAPVQSHMPAAAISPAYVAHLYVVRTPGREALRAFLKERGIGSDVHYARQS